MPGVPEDNDDDGYPGTVISFMFDEEDTSSSLTVLYQNLRIHIDISLENLEDSCLISNQYMMYLGIARDGDCGNLNDLTVEDFFTWILRGCAAQFTQLATPLEPSTASLHDCIHPTTYHFTLRATTSDRFTVIQENDTTPGMGARIPNDLCSPWRSYKPSDVRVRADPFEEILSCRKVTLGGPDPVFFKSYRWCDSRLAKRELDAYKKIDAADLGDLRISRLHGLVREDDQLLFGLLLSYIDGQPLTHAIGPDVPQPLLQQWVEQITLVVTRLHEAGIVWGDAKPDNVLIDASNDAWIIDFGGGDTEGWVDSDLAGTKEGDAQGLSRIVEFLQKSAEATLRENDPDL
jgi:hypothetical protein